MKIFYGFLRFIRRHKYFVALFVFALLVGGIDENSLLRFYALRQENAVLRREIAEKEAIYAHYAQQLSELSRPEAVERVARVELGMHTDDEDVYLIQVENEE
ncbi:MAG: septum formation initiator family protein [Prevotellaceae bacterium]|nr:septum formation initiator family protein [Prevotellaceae bacterium]